jgi:hypothetical protein
MEQRDAFEAAKNAGDFAQLKKTTLGIGFLCEILGIVEEEVEEQGYICLRTLEEVGKRFGSHQEGFARMLAGFNVDMEVAAGKRADEMPTEGDLPPERRKEILLLLVRTERKTLEDAAQYIEKIDQLQLESQLLSLSLPPEDVMRKILRYDTTFDRQLYRALDALEHLQRQRSGEPVPPPLKIRVVNDN